MITVHPIESIVSDPEIRAGQPIVAGTRVRVSDIAAGHIYRGQSPEELAVNYVLDMGQVYAALAYYYQHREEIDAQMRADAEEATALLDALDDDGKLIRLG